MIVGSATSRRCGPGADHRARCNQEGSGGVLESTGKTSSGPQLNPRHAAALVIALSVLVVGCASSGESATSRSAPRAAAVQLPEIAASPAEHVASAPQNPAGPGLPAPLVNPGDIKPGGPPPDGIPAIDHPKFERADRIDWIHDQEPVLALTVGADSRAYPVQVLIWHEIVNDTVGGIPVAVTYCPLCNTAIAYGRQIGQRVLSFGTSGELYNSDLVMYDRQTQSLWVQFVGKAVAGVLTGTKLTDYPLETVSWKTWRTSHPQGWVLSRDTGFNRSYGTNPYPGYDNVGSSPFLFSGRLDTRFPAMARVVGIRLGDDSVAVPLTVLEKRQAMNTEVGGQPLVVAWQGGTSSPLDSASIAAGADIGSTGVFSSLVNGQALRFEPATSGLRDIQTGSTWNILGQAVAGPLAGTSLAPIAHVDTFWFVWAVFLPHTRLLTIDS